MAKVLMPLLSSGARGALGKMIVFFPWKGINAVRSYVIPANPNSASQQAVRGWFKDAVLRWRTLSYNADDKAAYNRWALLDVRSLSGFNEYMSLNMKVRAATKTFSYPLAHTFETPGAGQLKAIVCVKDNISDYTVDCYLDTKQGGTLYKVTLTWVGVSNRYEGTKTGLLSGVKYFGRFQAAKTGYDGWLGDGAKVTT